MRQLLVLMLFFLIPLQAVAAPLSPQQERAVDETVREWLAGTEAPSVSIAVVRDGKVAYARAYGNARLHPDVPATPQTRYRICSVTKQFTAAGILALQDEGKLSLDDRVAKYFPDFASADKVSIRQILSHTASYPDFWPADVPTPRMMRPVDLKLLLDEWATKPLASEPGTEWRYSNTNFFIAGAIVEKVSGEPYFAFLQSHIFAPLRMNDVEDNANPPPRLAYATGYTRFGEGPVRQVSYAGPGWEYAAGGLAMTPTDLAKWDISLMDRALLSPQAYEAFYTPVKLNSGVNTKYSLGLGVYEPDGRLDLQHGGDGPGFAAENMMWPAEKSAVVVLTNNEWTRSIPSLRDDLVARIAYVVLPPTRNEARARAIFDGFRRGAVDRALFNDEGNALLTAQVLADQKEGLARFGPPRAFIFLNEGASGGMMRRNWKIRTANGTLSAIEIDDPNGKLEQFVVSKAE